MNQTCISPSRPFTLHGKYRLLVLHSSYRRRFCFLLFFFSFCRVESSVFSRCNDAKHVNDATNIQQNLSGKTGPLIRTLARKSAPPIVPEPSGVVSKHRRMNQAVPHVSLRKRKGKKHKNPVTSSFISPYFLKKSGFNGP